MEATVIMGAIATALCFGSAAFAWRKHRIIRKETTDIDSWVTTVGKITSSRVYRRGYGEGSEAYAELSYEFDVLGQTHKGRRATFDSMDLNIGAWQNLLRIISPSHFKFREGASVTVYYDLKNPTRCVLSKNVNEMRNMTVFCIMLGIFFAYITIEAM